MKSRGAGDGEFGGCLVYWAVDRFRARSEGSDENRMELVAGAPSGLIERDFGYVRKTKQGN